MDAGGRLDLNLNYYDVGNAALFLGSDLAKNITGQTIFVDAGYSTLAMAEIKK